VLQDQIGQTNRANLLLLPGTQESPDSPNLGLGEKLSILWANIRGIKLPRTVKRGPEFDPKARLRVWEDFREEGASDVELANKCLRLSWDIEDAQLILRAIPGRVELRSDRVFLEPPVVEAARKIDTNAQPILTYLVNEIRDKEKMTPYSMVTAIGRPIVPPDMHDDEIILNDWLADDLEAFVGDKISLSYYVIASGRALEERTNSFHVKEVVKLSDAAADQNLMPDFPGIAQAESTSTWDAGFPIQTSKIRFKDEEYWKQHRGTPKAFVTLGAGQKMWTNRFGDFTAIRFRRPESLLPSVREELRQAIDPASLGLKFQPVREQALASTNQVVPFGQLFLGFSFFLIIAALLLTALLFQFGLERRAAEVGTLLALGFRPGQVRRLLLFEAAFLALVGGIIGALGGVYYAKAMLHGLTTIWRDAVGSSSLEFHVTPETLLVGAFSSVLVAVLTLWFALRRQARQPVRELLAEGGEEKETLVGGRNWSAWIAIISSVAALAMVGMAIREQDNASAETFFSAGALLLIGGLAFCAMWLRAMARRTRHELRSLGGLGLRSATRRRKRSLATIGLLAGGVFLIVAVGAFRLDANRDAWNRSSGTGGFALIGESALPITYDLNAKAGRDFYGLNASDLANVNVVAFRVRDGDEASCLNLNRALQPRLLGVNPEKLKGRFTFASVMEGAKGEEGWALLGENSGGHRPPLQSNEVAAIGDANSIQWAMGKKVGDTIDYTDERGQTFKVRLVGAVANSILQGSLIIDEAEFVKRFPSESGYRMFLLDAPSNSVAAVSGAMTRALQDAGLELTPAAVRLNAFNAVQNTYLSTFQVLGGLGLLLGSAGLGIVVLRNVQERRGELALLLAVGFRRQALRWLVLSEHGALLALGLGVGVIAAAIGVLPALLSPGSQIPYGSLALTLGAVLLNGLVWTWLAMGFALRGRLLDALRNE
jgi:ABC-type antimicrobial peptide transport system permease subunit